MLGVLDVLGGRVERTEAAEVVSDIDVETGVEAGDVKACVVLLGSIIAEKVGGIKGADVSHQRGRRVFVEISQVVGKSAAMERVAGYANLLPDSEQFLSCRPLIAVAAEDHCCGDGFHCRVRRSGVARHESCSVLSV